MNATYEKINSRVSTTAKEIMCFESPPSFNSNELDEDRKIEVCKNRHLMNLFITEEIKLICK